MLHKVTHCVGCFGQYKASSAVHITCSHSQSHTAIHYLTQQYTILHSNTQSHTVIHNNTHTVIHSTHPHTHNFCLSCKVPAQSMIVSLYVVVFVKYIKERRNNIQQIVVVYQKNSMSQVRHFAHLYSILSFSFHPNTINFTY